MKLKKIIVFALIIYMINGVYAFTDSIVCTGDSMVATGGSPAFCTQLGSYMDIKYSNSNTVYMTGVSGGCCSAYGSCSTKSPLVNRYTTDVNAYNSRFSVIHSIINDNGNNVPMSEYESAYSTTIQGILSSTDGSLIITTMPQANYALGNPQRRFANMSSITRELAIKNEIALLEIHYLWDHNLSYTSDGTHYNQAGHNKITTWFQDVIDNYSGYVMTANNWHFYYDCNNVQKVMNFTLYAPSNNCINDGSVTPQDWIVLKNITQGNFTIERKDNNFQVSYIDKFEPMAVYNMSINGTYEQQITINDQGGYNNLSITAGEGSIITFDIAEIDIQTNIKININAITNTINATAQYGGNIQNFTGNTMNLGGIIG